MSASVSLFLPLRPWFQRGRLPSSGAAFCYRLKPSQAARSNGMAVEDGEVVLNGEPARSDASCTATGATTAPSCYRVSVVSGSLEVSARLKNADDLELLMKVLDANKGLFPRVERSATESVVKATTDRSETDGFARADRETKTSSRADRLANGILTP
jgi:hypothetical protein